MAPRARCSLSALVESRRWADEGRRIMPSHARPLADDRRVYTRRIARRLMTFLALRERQGRQLNMKLSFSLDFISFYFMILLFMTFYISYISALRESPSLRHCGLLLHTIWGMAYITNDMNRLVAQLLVPHHFTTSLCRSLRQGSG